MKHGYDYFIGEATNSYSVSMSLRYPSVHVGYSYTTFTDFEFEGEKPFADVDYGELWGGKPGVLGLVQGNFP
eukprot:CAMPEP_0202978534 /NCGR_PEP_ID=MMETSP1396-20130829/84918_1 /ASSEMBLY_ACC=CAM_ASM_000872 /TAXON_ID= /ORGANISM="Pseudokeronopsis sp., Strain Brazil" /LENGTH=71 /DNA_ID=CAMNT_0049717521 /DNA_START=928 /DNA_END=1139 /DNA_ORIENTATION=+